MKILFWDIGVLRTEFNGEEFNRCYETTLIINQKISIGKNFLPNKNCAIILFAVYIINLNKKIKLHSLNNSFIHAL